MAQLVGTLSGGAVVGVLTGDALVSWVTASCVAQGVPVKVTDGRVVDRIRILLTGESGAPRRSRRPAGATGARSQVPDRRDSPGVQRRRRSGARRNDDVIEDRLHDGDLAVEVEVRPLSA